MCLVIYTFSWTLGLLYCLIVTERPEAKCGANTYVIFLFVGGVEVFLITELLINHVDFSICCCAIVFSFKYEWLHQVFFLVSYRTANEREWCEDTGQEPSCCRRCDSRRRYDAIILRARPDLCSTHSCASCRDAPSSRCAGLLSLDKRPFQWRLVVLLWQGAPVTLWRDAERRNRRLITP